jgi:hypothetical protein
MKRNHDEAPTKAELIARLVVCTAALAHRAEETAGEYKDFYQDRAEQCRSWIMRLRAGDPVDVKHIAEGLAEFEAMAL